MIVFWILLGVYLTGIPAAIIFMWFVHEKHFAHGKSLGILRKIATEWETLRVALGWPYWAVMIFRGKF